MHKRSSKNESTDSLEERYSSCIGSEDIIKQIPAEVFIKAILEDHLTERERRMVSLELQRRNRRCVKK